MFKKLRNKLIWINLGVTTVVILSAFTTIYLSAINSANNRPPRVEVTMGENKMEFYSEDFEQALLEERQAAAADLLRMLVVAGVAIEIVVAVISYFLAEKAIKPVREAYTAQKVFIANASHEIKTPLAAISANLEAADIVGNKWIDNVALETEKLTKLNGELLELARTDLVESVEVQEVDLKELVAETVESFESRLVGIDFKKTISYDGRKVKTNPEDLIQILRILLDNAIKYCEHKIIMTADDKKIVIKNDGVKISAKDLPHVFERFYQTDKSAEGVGLGLSIAKSLADRNGWRLTARSDKMTSFTLSF